MSCSSPPHPCHLACLVRGQGREDIQAMQRYGGNGRYAFLTAASITHVACGPLPAGKHRYSRRHKFSEVYTNKYAPHCLNPEVEHCVMNMDPSVMVLLIQATEGLFESLRKDNDSLCSALRVCGDSILFPFLFFSENEKKPHTLAREAGKLKLPICFFLVLKTFPRKCRRGTKRIAYTRREHMTKGS